MLFRSTDLRKLNATMSVGATISHNGVAVKFLGGDARSASVEITRP